MSIMAIVAAAGLFAVQDVESHPAPRAASEQAIDGVISWMQRYRAIPNLSISVRMEYTPIAGPPTYAFSVIEVDTLRKAEKLMTVAALTDARKGTIDVRQTTWDGSTGMSQTVSKQLIDDIGVFDGKPHAWTFGYRAYDDFIFSPEGKGAYHELYTNQSVSESDYWLPFALERKRADFSVEGEQIMPDGDRCIILARSELDRLWVAPERGYAVHRREIRESLGGPITERTTLSEFKQIHNIWLPFRILREEFGTRTDEATLAGHLLATKLLTVKSISIDPIADDRFHLEIAPGTHVIDGIKRITYNKIGPPDPQADRLLLVERMIKSLIVLCVVFVVSAVWWSRRRPRHGENSVGRSGI